MTPEYEAAEQARLAHVSYISFPFNRSRNRKHYRAVFSASDRVLESSQSCCLIHYRNGKDRSCFVCSAVLRLQHKFDHRSASKILKTHYGTDDQPLFKYDAPLQASREWFEL